MDKSGNIVGGKKCIEDSNGLKNFMSFNGQCVTDNKPIDYCKDDILQLADPRTGEELPENTSTLVGNNLNGLFGNDATTSSS